MSSAAILQPPGQPQSKALPTAQLSVSLPDEVNDEGPRRSEAVENVRAKPSKVAREARSNDFTSLPTTLALIQRILAPDKHFDNEADVTSSSIEDILPPLTSSNEVDVELYAILAIIVKDFVNTWYTKITPDHSFVEEIIQIFAHCSRALEQRLRRVDITVLLLDEIPLVIQNHINAYRAARSIAFTSPYAVSLRHLYHTQNPHPALTPTPEDTDPSLTQQQRENERVYRQLLVQGTLAILLPTEDLQNGPLRVLVTDIVADLIIGQALAGKVCYGWFLHDAITKVTSTLGHKIEPKASGLELRSDAENRLEKFGLLSTDSKFQHDHSSSTVQSQVASWFWRIMQYLFLAFLFLRYVLKEFNRLYRNPMRYHRPSGPSSSVDLVEKGHLQTQTPTSNSTDPLPQPVIAFGIYSLISTLLKLVDRMPWLESMLEYGQHVILHGPGRMGELNSLLDRFLYRSVSTHVLNPSLLPMVLRNLRAALFPNNAMGPPAPPPPLDEEQRQIKHVAAQSLSSLIPGFVAHRFYTTDDDEEVTNQIEADVLDVLDDQYLNKHLVYAILELILIRLIPELEEQPISELLAERGVVMTDGDTLDKS